MKVFLKFDKEGNTCINIEIIKTLEELRKCFVKVNY